MEVDEPPIDSDVNGNANNRGSEDKVINGSFLKLNGRLMICHNISLVWLFFKFVR